MSDPAERREAARLDELAAVTKAYGRFFGHSSGLGAVLIGAWILGAEAVLRVAPGEGEFMFVVAPIVWIGLSSYAREYYQRRGEVIGAAPEGDDALRILALVGVLALAVGGIVQLLDAPRPGRGLVVAALVVTPMLALRVVRTSAHMGTLWLITMFAIRVQDPDPWWARFRVGWAVVWAVLGVVDHLRYRRLERRLAALKERA